MALESLKLLEAKLSGFLECHEQVRSENAMLTSRLDEQEQEVSLLLERVHEYETERDEVRDRLEKILTQFGNLGLALEDEG